MCRLPKKGKERARLAAAGEEPAVFDYSLVPLTKLTHHRAKNDLPPVAHLHGRCVMAQSQWKTWTTKVLPQLHAVYLNLLFRTESLRKEPPEIPHRDCTCDNARQRKLTVTVVKFTEITKLILTMRPCRLAAEQLVEGGLFPCAPTHPTLAVDIHVLEFVTRLFVHLPPNNTVWCAALESFLGFLGYSLAGKDPLRRRFGNTLQFYSCLKDSTTLSLDKVATSIRNPAPTIPTEEIHPLDEVETNGDIQSAVEADDDDDDTQSVFTATPLTKRPPGTLRNPQKRRHCDSESDESESDEASSFDESPFPEPPNRDRPSDYLQNQCPCCFGGVFPREGLKGPNALVSLDACFTQKHRQKDCDPPLGHPRTVFLPEADVDATEQYVDALRSSASHSRKRQRQDDGNDLNKVEAGMLVSNAVLAGEKQHYVIALLETLFQHLPHTFSIGVLYDIASRQNAIAIKCRLRERLQHRKFELDPLERAHRRKALDKKAHRQTEDAVKCREPTIDNLYSLDVDDDIWQDIGLQNDNDTSAEPPDWLSKDSVRNGIKGILLKDWCDEEDTRLVHERCALQEWFSEKWEINEKCLKQTVDDKVMHYQFIRRRDELIQLCALWKMDMAGLSIGNNERSAWGPSQDDILTANIQRNMNNIAELEGGDISDDEVDDDEADPTYFAALDAINMADAFCYSTEELELETAQVDHEDPFL
ncbi:hypothetical protein EYR40_010588 [Pleurotus pulmonarius]|nr:hypothetical protein EYR40_010588 [Pleurotus pulmonarius]